MNKVIKERIKRGVSNEWSYMTDNNIQAMSLEFIAPLKIETAPITDVHKVFLYFLARKCVNNINILIRVEYDYTDKDMDFIASSVLSTKTITSNTYEMGFENLPMYDSNLEIYYNEEIKRHILVCDVDDLVIRDNDVYMLSYLDQYMQDAIASNLSLISSITHSNDRQWKFEGFYQINYYDVLPSDVKGLLVDRYTLLEFGKVAGDAFKVDVLDSASTRVYNSIKRKYVGEPVELSYEYGNLLLQLDCVPLYNPESGEQWYIWRLIDNKKKEYYDIFSKTPAEGWFKDAVSKLK